MMQDNAIRTRPSAEVVIHINETLDGPQREGLKSAMLDLQGVSDAEFCPSRFHLMLAAYDPQQTSSRAVLDQLLRRGLHAQLVGPI